MSAARANETAGRTSASGARVLVATSRVHRAGAAMRGNGSRDPTAAAHLRPRHARLCGDPSAQPESRPVLGRTHGPGARGHLPDLVHFSRRVHPLFCVHGALLPGAMGTVAAQVAENAVLGGGAARSRILDPVLPRRPRAQHACRRRFLRRQLRLLPEPVVPLLRDRAHAWRPPAHCAGDRLGPRHDRHVVLAAAQAMVPPLAAAALRRRAARTDIGNCRYSRRRARSGGAERGSGVDRRDDAGASATGSGGYGHHRRR